MRPVTLVVPCFDEARRLDVDAWARGVAELPGLRLLFVDDGSTDGTAELLAGHDVVRLPENRGKGEAVRAGLRAAVAGGAEVVGYWDADLATPLAELPDLVDRLRAPRRVVMGARLAMAGHHVERSLLRHYAGRVFATAAAARLGLDFYDTQCGAKVLDASDGLGDLLDAPFHSRWAFDVELLARVLDRWGPDAVEEVPLRRWHHRAGSKVRPWDLPRGLWDVARIRRA